MFDCKYIAIPTISLSILHYNCIINILICAIVDGFRYFRKWWTIFINNSNRHITFQPTIMLLMNRNIPLIAPITPPRILHNPMPLTRKPNQKYSMINPNITITCIKHTLRIRYEQTTWWRYSYNNWSVIN